MPNPSGGRWPSTAASTMSADGIGGAGLAGSQSSTGGAGFGGNVIVRALTDSHSPATSTITAPAVNLTADAQGGNASQTASQTTTDPCRRWRRRQCPGGRHPGVRRCGHRLDHLWRHHHQRDRGRRDVGGVGTGDIGGTQGPINWRRWRRRRCRDRRRDPAGDREPATTARLPTALPISARSASMSRAMAAPAGCADRGPGAAATAIAAAAATAPAARSSSRPRVARPRSTLLDSGCRRAWRRRCRAQRAPAAATGPRAISRSSPPIAVDSVQWRRFQPAARAGLDHDRRRRQRGPLGARRPVRPAPAGLLHDRRGRRLDHRRRRDHPRADGHNDPPRAPTRSLAQNGSVTLNSLSVSTAAGVQFIAARRRHALLHQRLHGQRQCVPPTSPPPPPPPPTAAAATPVRWLRGRSRRRFRDRGPTTVDRDTGRRAPTRSPLAIRGR